jgi:hypothetical protein
VSVRSEYVFLHGLEAIEAACVGGLDLIGERLDKNFVDDVVGVIRHWQCESV